MGEAPGTGFVRSPVNRPRRFNTALGLLLVLVIHANTKEEHTLGNTLVKLLLGVRDRRQRRTTRVYNKVMVLTLG
ncbi:MAG: hypothetical protein Q7S26_02755, partial [bacterium]|nr:hypothetical protein [bacterium]